MRRELKWRFAIAVTSLLFILMAGAALSKEKNMVMPTIRYWSNVSSEAMPLEMTIYEAGLGILQVRSNRGQEKETVVGMFRAQVAPEQLDGLFAALRSDAFRSLSPPEGITPGQGVRSLSIFESKQQLVEKFATDDHPPSPPFLEAEGVALKLVAALRQKPVQAVSLQGVTIPKQFVRGSTVQFDLSLANPGSEAVALPAPARWEAAGTMLMAMAVRSDVPPTQITPQHQHFESVSGGEVTLSSINPEEGRIAIAPGQQLKLSFTKKIDWPPGLYDVHLALKTTLTDSTGQGVERYELLSPKVPVQCEGKAETKGDRVESAPSPADDEPPQFVLDA